jgi:phage I-like protein
MNHLILNRDFRLPDDGWYHIAPLGEFTHTGAGILQVIDQGACIAMAARFSADAKTPNFPGLLIDFDHFSLDGEKRSEAAGWILGLENRESGLWAQIRWSDSGEEAVKGGRYRFLSPVWARADCVDLGPSTGSGPAMPRVRPVRILNAAVTNDPNLKGMVPLSNRTECESVDYQTLYRRANNHEGANMKAVIEKLVNHLGLAADATEAVILEKMGGLNSATVVTELQNSLTALQTKHDGLVANLKIVEGELVNRHLAEFEGVISEGAKPFWTEQLIQNRTGALAALGDLREMAGKAVSAPEPTKDLTKDGGRKPLHNRATARPLPPAQGDQTGAAGDSKAVRIRNRAHEIAKAEKIPFGVAFRRAEKEVIGQ